MSDVVDATAPLILADGTLVFPDGRVVKLSEQGADGTVDVIEIPTPLEAQALVLKTRRTTQDLPDLPRTMNAISVVLSYTLFGLNDEEIALTANITVTQVIRIKALPAYTTMHNALVENLVIAAKEDVRSAFALHSQKALDTMVQLMDKGKQEVRLAASTQVLDRAGLRPVDNGVTREARNNELRIVVITKDERALPITIDLEDTI